MEPACSGNIRRPRSKRIAASGRRNGGENPIFDTVRQSYLAISDKLLGTVEEIEGLDEAARKRLRFATKGFVDAMSPANFMATNPEVMKRTIETKGENLLAGLRNMLADISQRAGDAEPRRGVRAGPQPGDDAGQGDLRNAAVPADPICADDGGSAGNAAGDFPAVDQPLLHPRPHAREKLRQMDGRPGRQPVHGQLEIGRREHRAT